MNTDTNVNDPKTTTRKKKRSSRIKDWINNKSPYAVIFLLLVVIIIIFLWQLIFITITPGKAGVLFDRFKGTQIDRVYGTGLHIISPLNTMHIYEVRKQVKLHEFEVLTINGLHVHLSLAIRYQPDYDMLGILHEYIGPDYLQRVILPQIESIMRKQLGNYTAEQIYTNEEGLMTRTILLALEEVGRNYVDVKDILIRSISLPPQIKQAIENKITQEEIWKSYTFRLKTAEEEAKRKRIEAKGIRDYQSIINETLTDKLLSYEGIKATQNLAESENSKIVVIGAGEKGLPVILGGGK